MGSRRIGWLGAVLGDVRDHGIARLMLQVPCGQAKPAWRATVDCHLKVALQLLARYLFRWWAYYRGMENI